jgi:hypothetical protein
MANAIVPKPAESAIADKPEEPTSSFGKTVFEFFRKKRTWRTSALIICFLGIPLGFLGVWYVWFRVIPIVWQWGFGPLSWQAIPAILALSFLAFLPMWLPIGPAIGVKKILSLYLADQDAQLEEAQGKVRHAESMIETKTEESEKEGLMPLIRYSREQLEAYYRIGLSQTRKSFFNSVIAMWIGFIIIVSGILQYVVPLQQFGLNPPSQDINVLVIAGGSITEIISALFLWVYRNSIGQLTYFYNRQMHIHNVLFCFRIAATMEKSDDTKKLIVEKVMEQIWTPERPGLVGSEGLRKLIAKAT